MNFKNGLLASILSITLLTSAAFAKEYRIYTFEQKVSKTYTKATKILDVTLFNGNIEVIASDRKSVKLDIVKRGSGYSEQKAKNDIKNIDVTFNHAGKKLTISAKYTKKPYNRPNSGASALIQLPLGIDLELKSSNGEIKVKGAANNIEAFSSNDSIIVDGAKGKLNLVTSNGAINVIGGHGEIILMTSNNDIIINANDVRIEAETSNGSISQSGRLNPGKNEFITQNSEIILNLPEKTKFSIDAKTSNAEVSSDFTFHHINQQSDVDLIAQTIKNPRIHIKCRTSNDDIKISKKP